MVRTWNSFPSAISLHMNVDLHLHVKINIHRPASSKWPFDSRNGGHTFSPLERSRIKPSKKGHERKNLAAIHVIPFHLDVSENGGTPKSFILIGFSTINHPLGGTPIFGNIHLHPRFCEKWPDIPDAGGMFQWTDVVWDGCPDELRGAWWLWWKTVGLMVEKSHPQNKINRYYRGKSLS